MDKPTLKWILSQGVSVPVIVQAVCDDFCANYCKYAGTFTETDEPDDHCMNCPMHHLV